MYRVTRPVAPLAAPRCLRLILVFVVLGIPVGAWWWAVAPPVVTTWAGNGFFPVQTEPTGYISADVQFGFWMILLGAGLSWWMRRRYEAAPVLALAVLVIGILGAAALAALVGSFLGPTSTPDVLVGTRVEGPLRVRAPGLLLVGPIAAAAWWFVADFVSSWRAEGDVAAEPLATVAQHESVEPAVAGEGAALTADDAVSRDQSEPLSPG